jgi:hypothetical protein
MQDFSGNLRNHVKILPLLKAVPSPKFKNSSARISKCKSFATPFKTDRPLLKEYYRSEMSFEEFKMLVQCQVRFLKQIQSTAPHLTYNTYHQKTSECLIKTSATINLSMDCKVFAFIIFEQIFKQHIFTENLPSHSSLAIICIDLASKFEELLDNDDLDLCANVIFIFLLEYFNRF